MSELKYGGIFDRFEETEKPQETQKYDGIFDRFEKPAVPVKKPISVVGKYEDYHAKVEAGLNVSDYKVIEDDDDFKGLVEWEQPKDAPYTITDFENDPRVIKNYEIFTDWLGQNETYMGALLDPASVTDDGPTEMMRDDVVRISSKLNKAMKLQEAPEEVKQAYAFLQDRFEEAELEGFGEWMTAVKDYGIDVVANYETMPLVIGGFFSKGAVPLAAQSTTRALLHSALSKGATALAANPIKAGAVYAGAFSGADDLSAQKLNIAVDKQQKYDLTQAGTATAVGSLFGAGATWGMGKVLGSRLNRGIDVDQTSDYSESQALQVVEEAIEGEYIPASVNDIIEEARRIGGASGKEPKDVTPEVNEEVINKFADDVGGGEATKEEVTEIILDAVKSGATGEEIKNKVAFKMMQVATGLTSKVFFGKAAGILTPLTKYSNTADSLQKRLAHEFGTSSSTQKEKVGLDFSEVAQRYSGSFNERYLKAIQPLALNAVKGELSDAVQATLNRAIRGESTSDMRINTAAKEIRNLFKSIGSQLADAKIIDKEVENYIPRMWNRKAIEQDQELFKSLLIETGQASNKREADDILEGMLDIKNQLSGGTGGSFFAAKRKLIDIEDESKFAEFFEQDLLKVVSSYNFQAGKSLAKSKVLGVRSQQEFINKWITPIEKEMAKAGKKMTASEKKDILKLYQLTTSEGLNRFGDKVQTGVDAYSLMNRLAYLPLATLSSLTEVFINISKAGVVDSVKGFGTALNLGHKTITKDLHSNLISKHNLTANEAWREMKKFGIAMEQGADQIGNRLAGDDLVHEGMQKVSNKFFRINLLDQWTHFVQASSYATGKNMIERHLKDLASRGSQARTHKTDVYEGRLNELNIDIERGIQWVQNGSRKDDPFYQELLSGAARYTNGVIMQPTAMSNLKPMLHSDPQTSILFQLLGYPAAFTNTVLKGAAKDLIKSPVRNGAKIATAGLIMTETSRWLNYVRSHGRNEENKSAAEIYGQAVARWGGNGAMLDTLQRARKSAMYSNSLIPYLTVGTGPLSGDVVSLAQQGVIPTVGKKVPLYGAMGLVAGKDVEKAYTRNLREIDKKMKDKLIPEFPYSPVRFNKGGEVNVPRASFEPDERKDKVTGLPYNKQAGSAFMDELDEGKTLRLGFSLGTLVSKTTRPVTNRLSEIIDTYTGKIFDQKKVEEIGDEIEFEVESPMLEGGDLHNDNYDPDIPDESMFLDENEQLTVSEYFEARIQAILEEKNSVKSPEQQKLFDELNKKKTPEEQKIAEETELGLRYQKLRGYSEESIENYNLANEIGEEIDPEDDITYIIDSHIRPLKETYDLVTRDNYKDIPKDFDKYEPLAEFVANDLLDNKGNRVEGVTINGLFEGAKQHIYKIISEGDEGVKEAVEVLSKAMPSAREKDIPDLTGDRVESLETFLKDSKVKTPIFRGISSYVNLDRDISFAMPREIGTHVGTEGQANSILARTVLGSTKYLDEVFNRGGFTREDFHEIFEDEYNYKMLRMDEAFGDSGIEVAEAPLSMVKGYINIKNPLVVKEDAPTWSAEYFFTAGAVDLVDILEDNLGRRLTSEEDDIFYELTAEAMEIENEKYSTAAIDELENHIKDLILRAAFNKKASEFFKKLGFDSIQYKNEAEPSLISEEPYSYILFDPEQFKNVNAVNFDPVDPRDMYDMGGFVAEKIGIDKEALEWAKSQRKRYPESTAYDGMGDAAAHLALGFIAKKSKNPNLALKSINLREYFPFPDRVGKDMDIHNNELGYKIEAPDFKQAEKVIDNLISKREAVYMSPQESRRRRGGYDEGGYVIKKGDTLSSIAERSNTTVPALMATNSIKDPNKIFVDQKLIIPTELSNSEKINLEPTQKITQALRKLRKPVVKEGGKVRNALRKLRGV